MLISVALGSFGTGYDLIFVAACWVLWSWVHVGFFGCMLALAKVKMSFVAVMFIIMFASYSETHLMFGVKKCLHVCLWSLALPKGKKKNSSLCLIVQPI